VFLLVEDPSVDIWILIASVLGRSSHQALDYAFFIGDFARRRS
jgi:hypothetical protein